MEVGQGADGDGAVIEAQGQRVGLHAPQPGRLQQDKEAEVKLLFLLFFLIQQNIQSFMIVDIHC